MTYYPEPEFEEIKNAVESELKSGFRVLSTSYLVNKFEFDAPTVQKVLRDLVALGDLKPHYRVMCSGPNQRYDVDQEFDDSKDIPRYEITCSKCGDSYVPSDENISVFFEPASSYLNYLRQAS
jgi:hypothetical protein